MTQFTSLQDGNYSDGNTWHTGFTMVALNQGSKTFSISGDHTSTLGSIIRLSVLGNTDGNDGAYTVSSVVFSTPNTVFTVNETIPSSTANGNIADGTLPVDGDNVDIANTVTLDVHTASLNILNIAGELLSFTFNIACNSLTGNFISLQSCNLSVNTLFSLGQVSCEAASISGSFTIPKAATVVVTDDGIAGATSFSPTLCKVLGSLTVTSTAVSDGEVNVIFNGNYQVAGSLAASNAGNDSNATVTLMTRAAAFHQTNNHGTANVSYAGAAGGAMGGMRIGL